VSTLPRCAACNQQIQGIPITFRKEGGRAVHYHPHHAPTIDGDDVDPSLFVEPLWHGSDRLLTKLVPDARTTRQGGQARILRRE
jgi:hypothetical protein